MTALTLAESRCSHCDTPSERQQALTAAVVEAARELSRRNDLVAAWADYHAAFSALRSALSDLDKEGM